MSNSAILETVRDCALSHLFQPDLRPVQTGQDPREFGLYGQHRPVPDRRTSDIPLHRFRNVIIREEPGEVNNDPFIEGHGRNKGRCRTRFHSDGAGPLYRGNKPSTRPAPADGKRVLHPGFPTRGNAAGWRGCGTARARDQGSPAWERVPDPTGHRKGRCATAPLLHRNRGQRFR